MLSPPATSAFVPADLDATTWANLQPLYQSLLDRELKCAGCLEGLLLDRSELDATASEAFATLYIAMTCDTEDEAKKKAFLDFVENVQPKLKTISFELDRKIVASPHKTGLDQRRYGVLLRGMDADVTIFREENVPLQTEDTKLGQQYNEVCGAMMVEFRGEPYTMPQMATFQDVTDRPTREEAWRAGAARRQRDVERLNEIFDAMVDLRHRMALNAGFENYRDYMFKAKHRFDYTPADCAAFHRACEEVCVPLQRRLDAERARQLGADPLRPWDLAVDVKGREPLRPFADGRELVEKASKLFHRLPGDLGAMFDALRDGDSLDLDSRKGKAPGGYQQNRDRRRKPFIFMNAAGLHTDLETMLHEAGHAFHSMLCRHDPLVHYRHAPMEFCEVASMSMELISLPYLDEFYRDGEIARAWRAQLEGIVNILPWIATIDAFQHWLYLHPKHTHDERTAMWIELHDRFGHDVSWEGLEDVRAMLWQRQLHLYEVPFYYIEYGIAQLGSLQLWLQSRRNQAAAIVNYKNALGLGGSRPLPELFAAAGLTFDFGPETVKTLMDEVQSELEKLPA